ncbi:hypothetical protein K438DRAFT_1869262 [Mycena galopus ATCC 62051]|nr:hypothetical protein K438DRAFT_1869262 [Mycena galopus ATCC 62051]
MSGRSRKRKKEPDAPKPRKPRSTVSKEKRRERDRKHRMEEGVREKQRIIMAERRAAVKARRRQWDPPKHAPSENQPHPPSPVASIQSVPSHLDDGVPDAASFQLDNGVSDAATRIPLTLAEQCALGVLSEMAAVRQMDISIDPRHTDGDRSVVSVGTLSYGSVASRDRGSKSIQAVFFQPMTKRYPTGAFVYHMLPPYVCPPTPLQKRMWYELGQVGPLTAVQELQMMVMNLANPIGDDYSDIETPDDPAPYLSSERRKTIRVWRQHPEYETCDLGGSPTAFLEAEDLESSDDGGSGDMPV